MTMINAYATLAEYRANITPPGNILNSDSYDDTVIERLIEGASRQIDSLAGRVFYPHVETHNFDVPGDDTLWLDDDLLEVITLTNGDATTITSADYILEPANTFPKYCLKLRDISTLYFKENSTTLSNQQAIGLAAIWGYREFYTQRAWKSVGALGAAISDTTSLTFTLTNGHTIPYTGGVIARIDNEIFNVSSSSASSMEVQVRGDNGSTAATHINGSTVKLWVQAADIAALTLELTRLKYGARFGTNVDTVETVTAAGAVLTPRGLPGWGRDIIARYKRWV